MSGQCALGGAGVFFRLTGALDANPPKVLPYDASAFVGIAFWVSGGPSPWRVSLFDYDATNPCRPNPSGTCDEPFGFDITVQVPWHRTQILFADLRQRSAGPNAPVFDPSHLFGMKVQVKNASASLFIDDVAFLCPALK
jgi:hypothetical protein